MKRRNLFEADPKLAACAPPEAREQLRGLTVPAVEIPEGVFEPTGLPDVPDDALGLLSVDGLIARTVSVPGGNSVELLLPGHLLQPWTVEAASFAHASWTALEPTCVLVIEPAAGRALAACQQLLIELVSRGIRRAHTLTVSAAVESVVGVESRVLLALWHLAEEVGRVTPEGVMMPLQLTHEMLAILVGSRRPSVSAALSKLADRGLVTRRNDRTWLLHGDPPSAPEPGGLEPGNG